MISVVFDTNTIVSGIYWPRSIARRCLAGLPRRLYALAVTPQLFEEYEAVVGGFQPRFPACNSAGSLAWLRLKARWVDPAPLGKQRSRDPTDDPCLACALASSAKYLVTRDDDLLVLGKPFGIQTITPARFLIWVRDAQRPTPHRSP
jgi:putative PIN family toxin of toxin-antitoxin system